MQLTTARQRQTGSGAFAADPRVIRTHVEADERGGEEKWASLFGGAFCGASNCVAGGVRQPRPKSGGLWAAWVCSGAIVLVVG